MPHPFRLTQFSSFMYSNCKVPTKCIVRKIFKEWNNHLFVHLEVQGTKDFSLKLQHKKFGKNGWWGLKEDRKKREGKNDELVALHILAFL